MSSWITTKEFAEAEINDVFHRQLDTITKEIRNDIQNKHILFRKKFTLKQTPDQAMIRISADDYYKLYINGTFIGQGPKAGYPFHYYYNEIALSPYLKAGENTIAVHTYYQGLINRVWVSGDNRHGLWLELFADDNLVLGSDDTFLCAEHTAFSIAGISGYDTQFMERYDASAPECDFFLPEFDDSNWKSAVINLKDDHTLVFQNTKQLVFEEVAPANIETRGDVLFIDFGAMYVGHLTFLATGKSGESIMIRCAQELNDDGTVRHNLRASCHYEEFFVLSGKSEDRLNQYDYKSFRYTELHLPAECEVNVNSIRLIARHYPFELKREYTGADEREKKIWDLCVRSLHYGVQCVIQDCMEREKGYYLGDGCYSILTYSLLTGDYAFMEAFFDDFLRTKFINRGLMTCANCSKMQEIAEYPMIMITLLLEYAELTGNLDFVKDRFDEVADIMDYYREQYADQDGLLKNLDKWSVVDWPAPRRDGYDADLTEGQVNHLKHNAVNAYYIGAIKCLNKLAKMLGRAPYADAKPLEKAFVEAFYDPEKKLFRDTDVSQHISLPGNIFAWWFEILPEEETRQNIIAMVREKRLSTVMFFSTFPIFCSLVRDGEEELMHDLLTDDNTWYKTIQEGGTTIFEGWSRNDKWNTSLFHLTFTYAAAFMIDWKIKKIFTFED